MGSSALKMDSLVSFVGGGMKLSNRLTRNNPVKPSRRSKRPTDLPRDDMYHPSVHQSLASAVLTSLLLLESLNR